MNPFKEGDIIKCIRTAIHNFIITQDGKILDQPIVGNDYIVKEAMDDDTIIIEVNGNDLFYFSKYFNLVQLAEDIVFDKQAKEILDEPV